MATEMHVNGNYSEGYRHMMKRRSPKPELWGTPAVSEDGRDLVDLKTESPVC